MTNETRRRINAYRRALPVMREKVAAAMVILLVAVISTVTSTYAWVTISRAPEVRDITTVLAANGSLEIALSKEDGSLPDEFDIDESLTGNRDVTRTNLLWGNLINLADDSYGIESLALRPARLNTSGLLTNPLWGAVYGSDGRVTNLDSNYAYVKYRDGAFFTSNNTYGVRAIASYTAQIADSTQQAYNEKVQAVMTAHQKVNEAYSLVPGKFSPMGTMISKYAQDKLDKADPGTDLAPYLGQVIDCFQAVYNAMLTQKDAYVALANFQSYMNAQNTSTTFTEVTWDDLVRNKAAYNAANTSSTSSNKIISLVGLSQFIADLGTMEKDLNYLNLYSKDYQDNGVPYYWAQKGANTAYPNDPNINVFISHLIEHGSMTIDLENNGTERAVTSLSASDATALLGANGKERKAYIYNGVIKRFEQNAVDESYRLNGNAACTIKVTYVMTITVYGKAYTKASGPCDFMTNYTAAVSGSNLVANDCVADDTYGLVVDYWIRTNAEETCLTLEGATTTNEDGTIVSYDGINRVWGSTGEAVLTTDSTTQGGGSCYIYYADTPEDMLRSLDLLDAMKVAFVDQNGQLLAKASMDTMNYYAVNGRITVPLVLDSDTKTTYEYTNELNEVLVGRAVTTLYTDNPVRISTIVYLDGDLLTNDDVLAAAEIQGQLNLQFGSSTNLKTIGSNELIDDTRSVSASVSKNTMDYDTAVVAADLTTDVTLNVQGTDPRQVTAFFVRAINSTQGSREAAMTFTKQADGTWTSSYKFTAPGTYYLRYVRLDGVDYALAEPQKVEVSGFTLESLSWGEPGDSAVIRTSASSYSETVSVKFASSDRSKLPTSVQARFVRTDGNTVNIPLTYSSSTGKWTGSGTFSTSGVYTLEYLVFDNKYKDLVSLGMDKTLDLSLGMYVAVYQNGGTLTDQYESGRSYSKDVWAKIFDNTGKELEALEGAVLYYSNGGSASGTINTDLTWNEANGYYKGTLPIVNAGRYRFSSVMLEGSYLTKCTESPVYTIISPDPPIYDQASECTKNDANGIQFVPLTNDAVIDNIRINEAASASAVAVVYNSETGEYYTAPMTYTGNGNQWSAALPTYNVQIGTDAEGNPTYEQSQEGTWRVAAIKLWDCYDKNSDFRSDTNPILWVANDEIGTNYLDSQTDEDGHTITADGTYDFSKLSTTVSGKVNVVMTPGSISLGGSTTAFGTMFDTRALGMSVKLTDGAGRVIPAGKVTGVTLNVTYNQPTDGSYGYRVNTGNNDYTILLNRQDAEDGVRLVSSSDNWMYVGQYQVKNLIVAIGAKTLTFTPGNAGVPTAYTLTTAGPTAECIDLQDVRQTVTTFGMTGNNVTGTFLESYKLETTNMKIALKGAHGQLMTGAVMEGVTANLKLTYKGGSQANGGYTFAGDTGYQSLTIPMTAGQNDPTYKAGSSVLLAGTYSAAIEVSVNGETETHSLSDISVYSMKPDVTMALTAGTPTSVTVNADAGIKVSNNTFPGNNLITNGGHSAVVFASCVPFTVEENTGTYNSYTDTRYSTEYANYTMPYITFKLQDAGSCTNFTLVVPNNNGKNATLTKDGNFESSVEIGKVDASEDKRPGKYSTENWLGGLEEHDCEYTYKTETPNVIGTQEITQITAAVGNATYTMHLRTPLSIVEENRTPPSITFETIDGFVTPDGKTSADGKSFTFQLPSALLTTGGASFIVKQEVNTPTPDTQTTGESPDELIKNTPINDNLNWEDQPTGATEQLYTVTGAAKKTGTHTVKVIFSFTSDVYKKQWTLTQYEKAAYKSYAEQTVTVSGTTKVTTITETTNVKSQLDYWEVDGIPVQPGTRITVTGNSVVKPILKTERTLVQRIVETKTTVGDVDYTYRAVCSNVTKTVQTSQNDNYWSKEYCGHSTGACNKTQGGQSAAQASEDGKPTGTGTDVTTTGTDELGKFIRDYTGVEWKPYGSPVEKDGTTTTLVQVYDGNGDLINQYYK